MVLSSTVLVSTWLDMKEKHSGDSQRTAMVKEETFAMINERMKDRKLQKDNTTLMAILHLLAGEMWNCDENVLRVHTLGVARFINQRGGLHCLGSDGALADVAVR
jgi:predicted hydrolase (HD superfamily)